MKLRIRFQTFAFHR